MTPEEFQIKKELVREHYMGSLMLLGKAVAELRRNRPEMDLHEAIDILYQRIENAKV